MTAIGLANSSNQVVERDVSMSVAVTEPKGTNSRMVKSSQSVNMFPNSLLRAIKKFSNSMYTHAWTSLSSFSIPKCGREVRAKPKLQRRYTRIQS